MPLLLVGFDSAWTRGRAGAIVGLAQRDDGALIALGPPRAADFAAATAQIEAWQAERAVDATLILLDQSTIVPNLGGQRPVEHLVSSPIGRRKGGVQPSNRGRAAMFGPEAPLWPFLARFGGAADPRAPMVGDRVFETYPALTLVALGYETPEGRLPKYNPARSGTFSLADWRRLCDRIAEAWAARGVGALAAWAAEAGAEPRPSKARQDQLDACICLLTAAHLAERRPCLMVGDMETGCILVPAGAGLLAELTARCAATGRAPAAHLHSVAPAFAARG
jgi:predicted RNase H-like nuclease